MLHKNMIFDLKISWTPHKCSTRCYTPRSNSGCWITNLLWYVVVADPREGGSKCQIKTLMLHRDCWIS